MTDHPRAPRMNTEPNGATAMSPEPCRLGYEEHDGYAYCFTHSQFVAYAAGSRTCHDTDRRREPHQTHRTAPLAPERPAAAPEPHSTHDEPQEGA